MLCRPGGREANTKPVVLSYLPIGWSLEICFFDVRVVANRSASRTE